MKHIYLSVLTLFLLSCVPLAAQSTGYISVPDASNNTGFVRMMRTSDNGFISLCTSGNAGANHEIVKWDANFHIQWSQNFPFAAVMGWNDIIETNDGKFVAMAFNQDHGGCNLIIKLSATGSVLWQKEYYLASNFLTSFAISKAAGNDPGFIFGGGACGASNYLVRCDANGTILWQQEYYISGGSGVETVLTINAENNAYIVSGYVGINADIDAYIMKIDSSNTMLWCKMMQEPTLPEVPAICKKTAAGNYILQCGYNSNPNYAQLFYYFTAAGNVTNAVKLSGPNQEQLTVGGFEEVSNGNIILNGSLNDSPMKYLYLELAPGGNIVWQKAGVSVNTAQSATGVTVARTANHLFALGGSAQGDGKTITVIDSTGSGACNSTTAAVISSAGNAYTQVSTTPIIIPTSVQAGSVTFTYNTLSTPAFTLCGTVGMPEMNTGTGLLQAYPNPAATQLTLVPEGKTFHGATVTVYNLSGEKLLALPEVNGASCTLDVSTFAAGMYFVEVWMDGERMVKRVVKE